MSMLRRALRYVVLLALGFALAEGFHPAVAAAADQDPLSGGATAYAGGKRAEAISLLADAIRRDPHDPRAYYLRALCLARTGHPVEARADLVVAAALEAREPHRYAVDATLADLSKPDRTLLNQFRWRAQSEDFARAFDQGLINFSERPVPTVRTDAGALRQKASVPLGRLTQPITLAELADAAAQQPAAIAVETGSNPFSDDAPAAEQLPAQPPAESTAAADPFGEENADASPSTETAAADAPTDPFAGDDATADAAPAASGKIPSSKLFGILGRVVARSAPVPSLDQVRNQLPNLPVPVPGQQPAAAPSAATPDAFGADVQPAGFDDASDFGPAPAAGDMQPPADEAEPAASTEEDPFG
jgi:hypothetical protein